MIMGGSPVISFPMETQKTMGLHSAVSNWFTVLKAEEHKMPIEYGLRFFSF